MAAPGIVGTSGGYRDYGGTLVVPPPAGALSYIAVVCATSDEGPGVTPPLGWTQVAREIGGEHSLLIYSGVPGAGESWSVSYAWSVAITIVGYDSPVSVIDHAESWIGNALPQVCPSVDALDTSLALRIVTGNAYPDTPTITYPPTATIGRVATVSTGADHAVAAVAHHVVPAGPTGTADWSVPEIAANYDGYASTVVLWTVGTGGGGGTTYDASGHAHTSSSATGSPSGAARASSSATGSVSSAAATVSVSRASAENSISVSEAALEGTVARSASGDAGGMSSTAAVGAVSRTTSGTVAVAVSDSAGTATRSTPAAGHAATVSDSQASPRVSRAAEGHSHALSAAVGTGSVDQPGPSGAAHAVSAAHGTATVARAAGANVVATSFAEVRPTVSRAASGSAHAISSAYGRAVSVPAGGWRDVTLAVQPGHTRLTVGQGQRLTLTGHTRLTVGQGQRLTLTIGGSTCE